MRRTLPWLPVPVAVLALALWRPGLLLGGAQSVKGFAVMVGVGLAGLLVLGAFWRRSVSLAVSLASLVVLALMAATLWPAFRERTVVEAFPPVVDVAATVEATPSTAPSLPPVVVAPSPTQARVVAPRATPTSARPVVVASAPPTKAPVAVARASAVRLSSGRFHGIHHDASGGAALYDVSGRTTLRFEDISFQGTPGPSVHLVHRGARSPKGGIRLGSLKGEHGSFSYKAPIGFSASQGWTVLVWCDTYDVPIAAADLS